MQYSLRPPRRILGRVLSFFFLLPAPGLSSTGNFLNAVGQCAPLGVVPRVPFGAPRLVRSFLRSLEALTKEPVPRKVMLLPAVLDPQPTGSPQNFKDFAR